MKTITTILLLLTLSASAKPKPLCIGYWIVTHDTEGYKTTPTLDLSDVYIIADRLFPDNCIDFDKRLKEGLCVEMRVGNTSVYVEVRKIAYGGKYRKLNKRDIKEYLK